MSNNYSDTHAPLIINKMSKAKYEALLAEDSINENELYLIKENNIDADNSVISNVGDPIADTDAANKKYVDDISAELNNKINAIGSRGVSYNVVASLPESGESGIIYLVPANETSSTYTEYLYLETTTDDVTTGKYEIIGSTETDLTNYATKTDLANYATKDELTNYATETELASKQNMPTDTLTQYGYGAIASDAVPIVIGSDHSSVSAAQITVTSAGILKIGNNEIATKSYVDSMIGDINTMLDLI